MNLMIWWWTRRLKSRGEPGSQKTQWDAAERLGKSGDPHAVAPLATALLTGDAILGKHAANALAQIKDRLSVEALIVALETFTTPSTNWRDRSLAKIKNYDVEASLLALGPLSKEPLATRFVNSVDSVPVDRLVCGSEEEILPKAYARLLKRLSWTPDEPRMKVMFALALGESSLRDAAAEGEVSHELLLTLLNNPYSRVREVTANSLAVVRESLPHKMTERIDDILKNEQRKRDAEKEQRDTKNRQMIEALDDADFGCLDCGHIQHHRAWIDEIHARGHVYISGKPSCLKCGSVNLAGRRLHGFLLHDQQVEYYEMLQKLGVKVGWVRKME